MGVHNHSQGGLIQIRIEPPGVGCELSWPIDGSLRRGSQPSHATSTNMQSLCFHHPYLHLIPILVWCMWCLSWSRLHLFLFFSFNFRGGSAISITEGVVDPLRKIQGLRRSTNCPPHFLRINHVVSLGTVLPLDLRYVLVTHLLLLIFIIPSEFHSGLMDPFLRSLTSGRDRCWGLSFGKAKATTYLVLRISLTHRPLPDIRWSKHMVCWECFTDLWAATLHQVSHQSWFSFGCRCFCFGRCTWGHSSKFVGLGGNHYIITPIDSLCRSIV